MSAVCVLATEQLRVASPSTRGAMFFQRVIFFISAMFLSALAGGGTLYLAEIKGWLDNKFFDSLKDAAKEILYETGLELPFYYIHLDVDKRVRVHDEDAMMPGATLLTLIGADDQLKAVVVDQHGEQLHQWTIDWFNLWPDPSHLTPEQQPKSRPGTQIHGAVLLDDGSLVFNFEHLGLMRIDACGGVIWRLGQRTHHSVHYADGTLWVASERETTHTEPNESTKLPGIRDYSLLQVTLDGSIIQDISIVDLLMKNDLGGFIYAQAQGNRDVTLSGDVTHLNDVEVFHKDEVHGFFAPGDIMISLRNLNSVFVFDGISQKIKKSWTGPFIRQHDPDFIDSATISVFDNNNIGKNANDSRSRIIKLDAMHAGVKVVYEGSRAAPFYTAILGKHQWLVNGNLLITEAMRGRVFEIDQAGNILWEYFNIVGNNLVGLVSEGQRLEPRFDAAFFAAARSTCAAAPSSLRK